MAVKYVFVTGGVVSGLGKGITAASLGRLLKARGYQVTMQKFDPYINIDPGTMNPIQHGEVFVTDDGAGMDETELTQLREDISKPCKETDRGFGLANVNERIRMYFGAEYGLTIDSAKGEGTRVTIVIPAILEEQQLLEEGGTHSEQET